jgi:hypothetical protein
LHDAVKQYREEYKIYHLKPVQLLQKELFNQKLKELSTEVDKNNSKKLTTCLEIGKMTQGEVGVDFLAP